MIEFRLFVAKFLGLLVSAGKPIGFLLLVVLLLGHVHWLASGMAYADSMGTVLSAFLGLGGIGPHDFGGWLRLIEFGADLMGLLLFAMLTAACIKALERSKQ